MANEAHGSGKSSTAVTAYDQDNWYMTTNPQANAACPGNNPFVNFAGMPWWVNYWWSQATGTYAWGDGGQLNSNFDPKQFFRSNADGSLTLRAFGTEAGKCITSEIVSQEILGYGTYLVTAKADQGSFAKLDPNVVFGIFTYQWGNANPSEGPNVHREIDMLETISQAKQGYPGNAQFTLQPAFGLPYPNLLHRITLPDTEYVTVLMRRPAALKNLELSVYAGNYSYNDIMGNPTLKPINKWEPVMDNANPASIQPYVPTHTATSCERMHINLYLPQGLPPASEQSITLTRYQHLAV